jgi:hypothetical protein
MTSWTDIDVRVRVGDFVRTEKIGVGPDSAVTIVGT